MRLTDGATIRGRVVENGKPVAGVEMALYSRDHVNGDGYDEVRIGTRDDGSFVFTNVPEPEDWYVYGKMESMAARGAIEPVQAHRQRDPEEIDLGDIALKPGHRVRGTVALSDGKPLPEGMRVFITPGCMACLPGFQHLGLLDAQTASLGPGGAFEFTNLATGPFAITTSVKGYGLAGPSPSLLPLDTGEWTFAAIARIMEGNSRTLKAINSIERRVEGDIDGLVIKLEPTPAR